MTISGADFTFVSDFARRSAAIVIDHGKEYLVETRLAPLAREHAAGQLDALIARLRDEPADGPLRARALDALTTNETSFFRDFHPFEMLRTTLLPALIAQRADSRTLTIWSAACSSGQEPYSLVMLLREHFPELATWTIRVLATDLSSTVLDKARRGIYSQFEVNRGLPAPYLIKYFRKADTQWEVLPALRELVTFEERNLIVPWPAHERFDLVLCRNVMIYFDVPTKQAILTKIRARLATDGVLMLGGAETTFNIDAGWSIQRVGASTLYRPAVGGSPV
jgi:chemotaxis protein methyltransferase CheR